MRPKLETKEPRRHQFVSGRCEAEELSVDERIRKLSAFYGQLGILTQRRTARRREIETLDGTRRFQDYLECALHLGCTTDSVRTAIATGRSLYGLKLRYIGGSKKTKPK
jgi:hypothetical protein